jgi:hypothetical protein
MTAPKEDRQPMTTREELVACPFCGGRGFAAQDSLRMTWQASCTECHAGTPNKFEDRDLAVTAWNARLASRQEVSVEELAQSMPLYSDVATMNIARALLAKYSITKRS